MISTAYEQKVYRARGSVVLRPVAVVAMGVGILFAIIGFSPGLE
jgi:hypothetical protein